MAAYTIVRGHGRSPYRSHRGSPKAAAIVAPYPIQTYVARHLVRELTRRPTALYHRHGAIESRRWVRDVTFGEDASCLRCGETPQILAALRHLTHTLIRRSGTKAIAAARRAFSCHPPRALALLFTLP